MPSVIFTITPPPQLSPQCCPPPLSPAYLVLRAMAGGHLMETGGAFFTWDLLTVAQLVHPELFTTEEVDCDIVSEGPSQGRIVRTGTYSTIGALAGRGAGGVIAFFFCMPQSVSQTVDHGPHKQRLSHYCTGFSGKAILLYLDFLLL